MSEAKTSYSFGRVLILINQEDMVLNSVITTQKHTLCFFGRIFMNIHVIRGAIHKQLFEAISLLDGF